MTPTTRLPNLPGTNWLDHPAPVSAQTPRPPEERFTEQVREIQVLEVEPEFLQEGTADVNGVQGIATETGKPQRLPQKGDIVFGCEIEEKIGQGGFGSVYLAKQLGLADRLVVLKLTVGMTQEPERLASLQHGHIVPIHSVGSHEGFQVLCMPFYGRQTLADVLHTIERTHTLPATGGGLLTTKPRAQDSTKGMPARSKPHPDRDRPQRPQPARELLAKLSFPESLTWVFTRLAEGLAHAHENGIFHLDLKPQNVLLTDSGVPMILDFGQAHDVTEGCTRAVGGTVRYMPPEQVIGFAKGRFQPDARMDLYALGVMMFELLTGKHPYPESLKSGVTLRQVANARNAPPPNVRQFNSQVSPGVAAIISKLLEPHAKNRYRSADEVVEDLNRHQQNRPLQFAGNPSLIERVQKYRRRHPIALLVMIAAAFGCSALAATGAAVRHAQGRATLEAQTQAAQAHELLLALRLDLASPKSSLAQRAAVERAEQLLAQYRIGIDPVWELTSSMHRLTAGEREKLFQTLGELALLCAHANRTRALALPETERAGIFAQALHWNRIAELCYAAGPIPPVVFEQRTLLNGAQPDEKPNLAEEAPIDWYVRAMTFYSQGQVKDALQALEVLTERDPSHAAGQFILGICYQVSGRFTDASERFQLAKVLAPKDPRPCQNRGNMLLVLNRPKEAHAEFTSAIRRDPNHAAAYYYRALSDVRLGRLPDAFADLAQAAKGQEMNFRALLLRAQLHDRKKDSAAAKADRAEAERTGPQDEADYVARGLDRSSQQDYVGALADFTKSTEVNPRYLHGWQNQANILSERLHQTEKALDPLDKALQLSAEFAPALAGKAVLLARLGQRPEAHKIMTQALAKNEDPMVLYQAACVYSLTSAKQAEDKTQALAFLRQALRNGFADFKMIAEDSDVDAIRKMPGFAAAVTSAKELQKK